MTKTKYLVFILIVISVLFILPNISDATVDVTRNVYSNNGSMKFTFKGLTLDTTHEYEFGLTQTSASAVGTWFLITEYTEETATIDLKTTTEQMRTVINAVDTGYITIKDKTVDTVVLEPTAVDLKLPYLQVTNFTVINNGKRLSQDNIKVPIRCVNNGEPYYQYEKITDENIIAEYKKIKANNGNVISMQSMLKTTPPSANWVTWSYWNGHDSISGMNGYGYTTSSVSAPDEGLYYLWLYFSGKNVKDVYGYILVDNLQPEIAVEGISLPETKTIELGDSLTLEPTFNPSTATNKIVTWTSSDETVASVDNVGKITPIKVGSTIITVTTQDGNKTATCTVSVTEQQEQQPEPEKPSEEPVLNKNFGNHTYRIVKQCMSWKEAKAYCEAQGGYLVTITSAEEQDFITSFAKEQNLINNRFWIGATDEVSEGKWKWVTGEKFDYSNWSNYQPDNTESGGQDFAVYLTYKRSYKEEAEKWDDINNGAENDVYFICEWGDYVVEQEKDTTISNEKIPNTGKTIIVFIATIAVLGLTVLGLAKYKQYKEI